MCTNCWNDTSNCDVVQTIDIWYLWVGAAKKHAVPYSTLKDRVHGRVRHGAKPGVKTILSPEEEEELAKFVRVSIICFELLRSISIAQSFVKLMYLSCYGLVHVFHRIWRMQGFNCAVLTCVTGQPSCCASIMATTVLTKTAVPDITGFTASSSDTQVKNN